MSTSPYLKMTLLTVGQATPETTVNDALTRIEDGTQRRLQITMSGGGGVLTADQFTTNAYFETLSATAACALTIPLTVDGNGTLVNRLFVVKNSSGFTCTVTSTGGTDYAMATGEVGLFFCGGTNITNLLSSVVTIPGLTALQNVVTNVSGTLTTEAAIYDINPFFGGKPTVSGGLMGYMLIGRNISLVSGAVGWLARARTAASDATKTVDIQKNGVSIGSIAFASGSNTGSFTFATTTTFSAGDRLEFFAPATQDSTLSDLSFFIKGVRVLP